jgi:hypothetical protein
MLNENSILDSKNVRGDPIDRLAKAGESAMHDDEISVGHNCARLIPKCRRQPFDEIEQSLAPRLDVSAVLDVARRPVSFGRDVVPLVEKCVEGLEYECLIPLQCGLNHNDLLIVQRFRASEGVVPERGEGTLGIQALRKPVND